MCVWSDLVAEGLDTQGLYRISSAKSKMERLCQLFESGAERVDLSDLPPHLISSCLKLYFRQVSWTAYMYIVVPIFAHSCATCNDVVVAVAYDCLLCLPTASRAVAHIWTLPEVPQFCSSKLKERFHMIS